MRENHFPVAVVVVVGGVVVIQSDITICVRSCEFEWMDENEHAMKKIKRRGREREREEETHRIRK